MSDWQQDPEVWQALDKWLTTQQKPLNTFMENIMAYSTDTSVWALLVVYGKFVMGYNLLTKQEEYEPHEAFAEAMAQIANDPLTQQIVAQMLGGMMNKGVGL